MDDLLKALVEIGEDVIALAAAAERFVSDRRNRLAEEQDRRLLAQIRTAVEATGTRLVGMKKEFIGGGGSAEQWGKVAYECFSILSAFRKAVSQAEKQIADNESPKVFTELQKKIRDAVDDRILKIANAINDHAPGEGGDAYTWALDAPEHRPQRAEAAAGTLQAKAPAAEPEADLDVPEDEGPETSVGLTLFLQVYADTDHRWRLRRDTAMTLPRKSAADKELLGFYAGVHKQVTKWALRAASELVKDESVREGILHDEILYRGLDGNPDAAFHAYVTNYATFGPTGYGRTLPAQWKRAISVAEEPINPSFFAESTHREHPHEWYLKSTLEATANFAEKAAALAPTLQSLDVPRSGRGRVVALNERALTKFAAEFQQFLDANARHFLVMENVMNSIETEGPAWLDIAKVDDQLRLADLALAHAIVSGIAWVALDPKKRYESLKSLALIAKGLLRSEPAKEGGGGNKCSKAGTILAEKRHTGAVRKEVASAAGFRLGQVCTIPKEQHGSERHVANKKEAHKREKAAS
jgi:hypothetical protein